MIIQILYLVNAFDVIKAIIYFNDCLFNASTCFCLFYYFYLLVQSRLEFFFKLNIKFKFSMALDKFFLC